MSDAQLEEKYRALAGEVMDAGAAEELLQAAWALDEAPNLTALLRLASRTTSTSHA